MDKLKIMTWNINQRTNYGKNTNIPNVVFKKLKV